MKKLLTLTLTSVFAVALAGCNTTQGIGKDIQSAGEGIQSASQKVEKKIGNTFDKSKKQESSISAK